MSVSPFLNSMSELRSFKIPAQSILCSCREEVLASSTKQIARTLTGNQAVIYTCGPAAKSKLIFTLGSINMALKEAAVMTT